MPSSPAAASGIGAAAARQLAAKGAIVVVADLQADKGEALAQEIGGVFAQVDVTNTDQITAAVNAAAEIAPLRAVVNSAGIGWAQRTIGRDGEFDSAHDLAAFTRVIAINLIGTFDMIRHRRDRDEPQRARRRRLAAARSSTWPASRRSTARSARRRTPPPRAASSA